MASGRALTIPRKRRWIGAGCLFNIIEDPSEDEDLAKRMRARPLAEEECHKVLAPKDGEAEERMRGRCCFPSRLPRAVPVVLAGRERPGGLRTLVHTSLGNASMNQQNLA